MKHLSNACKHISCEIRRTFPHDAGRETKIVQLSTDLSTAANEGYAIDQSHDCLFDNLATNFTHQLLRNLNAIRCVSFTHSFHQFRNLEMK